jgi:hypothetical protein
MQIVGHSVVQTTAAHSSEIEAKEPEAMKASPELFSDEGDLFSSDARLASAQMCSIRRFLANALLPRDFS